MNVYFRVDASIEIGTGHVMRCLTLADELRKRGANISFISRNYDGNINHLVESKGYKVYTLENNFSYTSFSSWDQDAKETISIIKNEKETVHLIVIDHYSIEKKWEVKIRPHVKKIMVIDDLANREHDCDILLDQNWYPDMEIRYQNLVSDDCLQLLGPSYALLREEFSLIRENLRSRKGSVNRILVFFGGSDPTNETLKALHALKMVHLHNIVVDVIVGNSNQNKQDIKAICSMYPNIYYYEQVENMAEMMGRSDLSIGAGGSATWERCFLGLPTLIIAVAENQVRIGKAVNDKKMGIYLGRSKDVTVQTIKEDLEKLIEDREKLKEFEKNCITFMRQSGTESVAKKIIQLIS